MKKIISTICDHPIGGTFVDWSIHFLSNQQNYFRWKEDQWIPLTQNPLTDINAHGHQKNHPWGVDATQDFFNRVLEDTAGELYSCYPIHSINQIAAKKLNLDINKFAEKAVYSEILEYEINETTALANLCFEHSSHVIFLETKSQALPLLLFFSRQLDLKFTNLSSPANDQELFDEQDHIWNSVSADKWDQLGLTEIWDRRERIALNIRPIGRLGIDCVSNPFANADFTRKHYRIGIKDLWCRGESTILQLMKYLELDVDAARWAQWQPIYHQWAARQAMILGFIDNLPYILKAIINNWYYCLPDLTFRQEVLIQHFLIYQYNLNIKTWQLKKFPNNTQDLHALLEPNLHSTQLLY
jgi:hypothetical protein